MNNIPTEKISKTIEALKSNNYNAIYAQDICNAKELVKSILNDGETVSFGGSETLIQCGIIELLKDGNYNLLDRYAPGSDFQKISRESFFADSYLCSSNAITENGELYNVDGTGNRIAAIAFGPKKVIIIAGYNKIVKNLDEAVERVKTVAAPKNCVRLSINNYCAGHGKCVSLLSENPEMASGCDSARRICRQYLISGKQPANNRISVIIVGEELGY